MDDAIRMVDSTVGIVINVHVRIKLNKIGKLNVYVIYIKEKKYFCTSAVATIKCFPFKKSTFSAAIITAVRRRVQAANIF